MDLRLSTSERYHALDSLRAVMMLLGLVLHSAASYMQFPSDAWPFKDRSTSLLFDLTVFTIHLFRMPAFFVLAGFFAALLYARRSVRGFIENRLLRIGLPLAVGWVLLYPPVFIGSKYGAWGADGEALRQAVDALVSGRVDRGWILVHLWFLYYLLLFYASALLAAPLWARLPEKLRARGAGLFRRVAGSPWRAVPLGLLTAATLLPMELGVLETVPSLAPPARILLAYGVFFYFGWALYGQRDLLERFQGHAGTQLAIAVPLLFVTLGSVDRLVRAPETPGLPVLLVAAVSSGFVTWLAISGMTGLFLRYRSRESRRARYLADASYWMYLAHLPITLWVPIWIAPLPWPAAAKFLFVLGVACAGTLITYELFVRSTVIGVVLNGRRYPRAWGKGPERS